MVRRIGLFQSIKARLLIIVHAYPVFHTWLTGHNPTTHHTMTPNEYRSRKNLTLTYNQLCMAIRWENVRKRYFANLVGSSDRVATCEAHIYLYTKQLDEFL